MIYRAPHIDNAGANNRITMMFSNFKPVSGMAVPFAMAVNNGYYTAGTTVTDAACNTGIAPSQFDIN